MLPSKGNAPHVSLSWAAQLCPALCDPVGGSHQVPLSMGFFRQEYWVVISFSRGSFRSSDETHVSCISCIAGGFFTAEPPAKIHLPNRRCRRQGSDLCIRKTPGEGNVNTLHFQAVRWKCHGQRNLAGYSPKAKSLTQLSNGAPHCKRSSPHLISLILF